MITSNMKQNKIYKEVCPLETNCNNTKCSNDNYYFLSTPANCEHSNPAPYGSYTLPHLKSFSDTIRSDFPILKKVVNGRQLIWFDNGATTQKPNQVINSLNKYYREYNSNVHRGAHTLSEISTKQYEEARHKVKNLLGASSDKEIVFLRGTTEAINLVSQTYGKSNIKEGDEILLTTMEHHSNIVPWQTLAKENKAKLKVIPINDDGQPIWIKIWFNERVQKR